MCRMFHCAASKLSMRLPVTVGLCSYVEKSCSGHCQRHRSLQAVAQGAASSCQKSEVPELLT